MWRILQQERARRYVLATGETHTVRNSSSWLSSHRPPIACVAMATTDRAAAAHRPGGGGDRRSYRRPTEVTCCSATPQALSKLGWRTYELCGAGAEMVEADRLVMKNMGAKNAMSSSYTLRNKRVWVAGTVASSAAPLIRRLQRRLRASDGPRESVDLARPDQSSAGWPAKPQAVFLAAARVGGIYANDTRPRNSSTKPDDPEQRRGGFAARRRREADAVGSSCIYPRLAPQAHPEAALLTGPLERPTNGMRWPRSRHQAWPGYRRNMAATFVSVMRPISTSGHNFDLMQSQSCRR